MKQGLDVMQNEGIFNFFSFRDLRLTGKFINAIRATINLPCAKIFTTFYAQ